MKIRYEEINNLEEVEVVVRAKSKSEEVTQILKHLSLLNDDLYLKKEGRQMKVKWTEIYYFDSVDKKVFAYTKNDVFETEFKLYQLEESLYNTPFIRINKTTILNTSKIISFASTLNSKMHALLDNKETVIISRMYVSALKMKLGGTI
ncbi:MAG: LytTR family DNA-binding domain-containing protein [Candidatus Izemoplasmatales bacterium]